MKRQDTAQRIREVKTKARRREIVLRRQIKSPWRDKELSVTAPEILSFSSNAKATLDFFEKFKVAALERERRRIKGKWVYPQLFVDLSKIKRISVPTAVILSAELHRWELLKRIRLRAKRTGSWSPRVRQLLNGLGAFDLLQMSRTRVRIEELPEEVVFIRLTSGTRNEGEVIDGLQTELARVAPEFERQPFIFDGLSEAVLNALDHAYVATDVEPRFPYAGHRWWATCCVDPNTNAFRFFVFDQGVGIPKTLRASRDKMKLVASILDKLGLERNDPNLIESALEIGKTRTGLAERGKGLSQMYSVATKAGSGYMRIVSGRGDVTFSSSGDVTKSSLSSHIGGTLIEWSIPLEAFNREHPEHV